jgi:hypothetical protein
LSTRGNVRGGFQEKGYDVRNDVVLNQVLVSFGDDERTTRIIDVVQTEELAGLAAQFGRAAKQSESVCPHASRESAANRLFKRSIISGGKTHDGAQQHLDFLGILHPGLCLLP